MAVLCKLHGGKIFTSRLIECYKVNQMKAYDIAELTAEVKNGIVYRNKTIYITVVVLFWCRRSIATGSSALTPYPDLLGVGKYRPLREWKICYVTQDRSKSLKVVLFDRSYTSSYSSFTVSSWPVTVIPRWRTSSSGRVGVSKASAFRFVSWTVCSPYPTLNLRWPSFFSRRCTDLEQSSHSSAAYHICSVSSRLPLSLEDILLRSLLRVITVVVPAKWHCRLWTRYNRSYLFTVTMAVLIDNVSMSVRHLDHVLLTLYSSMEHVTWKSPGPMCGWVGRMHKTTSVSKTTRKAPTHCQVLPRSERLDIFHMQQTNEQTNRRTSSSRKAFANGAW